MSAVRPILISYRSAAIPASTALATASGDSLGPGMCRTGSVSTSGGSTSNTRTGESASATRRDREKECRAALVAEYTGSCGAAT
jgi:hypothetical protein